MQYGYYVLAGFVVYVVLYMSMHISVSMIENFVSIAPRNACVINLKRRADRLRKFRSMSKYGQKCDVVEAVDGRRLNIQELLANGTLGHIGWKSILNTMNGIDKKHHYELCTLGAVGCYLSHYNAWKSILNEKLPYRYIFEDDANIKILDDSNYLKQITERIDSLPNDWHIYVIGLPHTMLEFDESVDDDYPKNLKKIKRFCGLHAYVVSYRGAQFLLDQGMLFPIQQQIDSHLSELALDYGLNVYIHTDLPLIPPIQDKTDIQVDSYMATDDRLKISETK